MECGTTCLAMIFKSYGYYDIRSFLSEKAEVNTEGTDLYTLSRLGEGFGFETEGYHLDYENLGQVHLPCIAHYEGNHFVVIYRWSPEKVWIADPAVGKYTMQKDEFLNKWNGIILVLNPTPDVFKHNELTELVEERRKKEKNIRSRFYLSTFSSSRKILYEIIGATLILQLLGLALPIFTQSIIDQVLVNQNKKLLFAILVGMLLVFVSQIVLNFGRNVLLTQFKVTFERGFFGKFFNHFIRLSQSYFDNHKREDFINRFQENLKIRQAMSPSILQGIVDFAFVFTYLIVLFFYNPWLGLISLLFVCLYILLTILFSPRLKNLENRIFSENVKTMGQFLDTLLGMQTVRLLGIEKLKFWKWKNQYTKALNKVLETEKTYITLSTFLTSIFLASQVSVYWVGAYFTFQNKLSIGQYIAFITIFTIIINSLARVTQLWFMFTELSVTFDRLNDVLMQEPAENDYDGGPMPKSPLAIKLDDVNFRYRSQDEKYVLKDISLEVKPGEFVGIVGRNGSGKTTLAKLICKLYTSYEGNIFFNNTELRTIHSSYLRKKISVIPQDIYLFDGTIKENILFGNPESSDEEIFEASKRAGLYDFVRDQYLGYNLKIGENGVNLSGGQKLKLAFARLFVSNPEIVILDEASSALDIETERLIMEQVKEKFKGKTIISIAHRIATLKNADKIVVLEDGKITEMGSHQELMKIKGLYKSFMDTYMNI